MVSLSISRRAPSGYVVSVEDDIRRGEDKLYITGDPKDAVETMLAFSKKEGMEISAKGCTGELLAKYGTGVVK